MKRGDFERERSSHFFNRLLRGLGRRAVEPSPGELLADDFIRRIETSAANASRIRTASSQPVAPEFADDMLQRVSNHFDLPTIKNLDIVQGLALSETLMDYDRGFNLQPLVVRGFIAKLGSLALGEAKLVVNVPRERDMFSLVVATPTPQSLLAIQNIQPHQQTEPLRLHYADISVRTQE